MKRQITILIALVCSLVVMSTSSRDGATAATAGKSCRDRGQTLLANSRARVFTLRRGDTEVWGCTYKRPKRMIDLGFRNATNGTSQFKLSGEVVAYKISGEGCSRGECTGDRVVSQSLRSGFFLREIRGPQSYVLKSNGSLAAIARADDLTPPRLVKADHTGTSVHDSRAIDPGSLALSGSRLYWIADGSPATAFLD